ncbi:uncharacterized protein [Littorina saxatilis]|uniref:uncharacterized protein isoform X2 n=1 Tax=Littorina saxatilis TaxID=31220 RepID=UPI0038B4390C
MIPALGNVIVEEKSGKGDCTLRYQYAAEKGDRISFTFEDTDQGIFHILFTVKRFDSERVVISQRSKPIPKTIKDEIVIKSQDLGVKKRMYVVKLKKKTDFNLDIFFRPDSPPV